MPESLSADQVIAILGLAPLPVEGGYFAETDRAGHLPGPLIAGTHPGPRSRSTAIYYLLTPDTMSAMHLLPGQEIFHHYLGDPVAQLQLRPDGAGKLILIGPDLTAGQRPQVIVPGGVWQGTLLLPGDHGFALLGTTMSPGYDVADYRHGDRHTLIAAYPDFAAEIIARTLEDQAKPPSQTSID